MKPSSNLSYYRSNRASQSERIHQTIINPQWQTSSSIKNTLENINLPQPKPFLAQVKDRVINSQKTKNSINSSKTTSYPSPDTPQRIKSSSMYTHEGKDKNNTKYDYLLFAQKQYKVQTQSKQLQSDKNTNSTSKINRNWEEDNKLLKEQNRFLKQKAEQIDKDLKSQLEKNHEKNQELKERNIFIEDILTQLNKLKKDHSINIDIQKKYQQLEVENQHNKKEYEQKYHQLTVQNQQVRGQLQENKRLVEHEKMKLKEIENEFEYLNRQYVQVVDNSRFLEQILQQKDQYLENRLETKQSQFKITLSVKNCRIESLQTEVSILSEENSKLKQRIDQLLKQAHQIPHQITKFQSFSHQLENKINSLVDENVSLKNQVGQQQGKIDQLNTQKHSLQTMIAVFEEREQLDKNSQLRKEIDTLRQQYEKEKQHYDMVVSKNQLQILRLENDLATKRYEIHQSLLDFTDNERLIEKFYSLLKENENLKKKLENLP